VNNRAHLIPVDGSPGRERPADEVFPASRKNFD